MRFFESELDLHRMTVDEALPLMDDYIYKAFTSGFASVCINHGKGTGTLKQAIHRELKKNSLVKSFRSGDRMEGGVGVTIVELAHK
jgi:DNA mismatch repair protein MutS2